MLVFLVILGAILVVNGFLLALLSRQFTSVVKFLPASQISGEQSRDYRPMARILDSRELLLLRRQPGFRPEMESRLRRQRAALFSYYLSSLEQDFKQTCDIL